IVADGEHEMHLWRARRRELIPALGAGEGGVMIQVLEELDGEGMHHALGLGACRKRPETPLPSPVQDSLGKDGPRGVARAQEQRVEWLIAHRKASPSTRR